MNVTHTPRTLAHHRFFSIDPVSTPLFAIREGVDALDALEQASCFLASAKDATYKAADEVQDASVYGAAYLIEIAKAVVDAAISGMTQENFHA